MIMSDDHRLGTPLFCLQDLGYVYPDGVQALSGVNLEIFPNDRLALVGPNGSGKTTLVRLLAGLLAPVRGHVLFRDRMLSGTHLDASRLEIGVLFQDPDDQLFGHTVLEDAAFGPRNQGRSCEDAARCAMQALEKVSLENLAYKEPHHLSYGQKKRAALAGILAMNPAVLILDEPTANLDPGQEAVFVDLLKTFSGTLICISHDLIFLYELCKSALVLHQGRIRHHCAMDDLVSRRRSLRDFGLDFSFRLNTLPHPAPARIDEGSRKPIPENHGQGFPQSLLIRLENFGYVYPDGTWGLHDFSLQLHAGEKVAVVGENGAGKSTLLGCLAGLRQGRGTFEFNGSRVTPKLGRRLWQRVGMVFQDCADQLFCASVYEEVAFGLIRLGFPRARCREQVAAALARTGLAGYEKRVPLHLSGGERKRLALACVLAMEPDLLILDEPTAGLDPRGEALLMELLLAFDRTLVLVSHDMLFIEQLTCRTLVMHQGRIIDDLATPVFMQDKRLSRLNGLSYSYRQRTTDTIRRLQHEHEHRHRHTHLHDHAHRHDDRVHSHLHAHMHDHAHRFVHAHPGGQKHHDHSQRRVHDHDHPGHDAEVHDHSHD
jgi:energy-coupling factor transport system ATP-binding protein